MKHKHSIVGLLKNRGSFFWIKGSTKCWLWANDLKHRQTHKYIFHRVQSSLWSPCSFVLDILVSWGDSWCSSVRTRAVCAPLCMQLCVSGRCVCVCVAVFWPGFSFSACEHLCWQKQPTSLKDLLAFSGGELHDKLSGWIWFGAFHVFANILAFC